MRIFRTIFALLIAFGLTMSPVAAGLTRAQMANCDHAKMMQMVAGTQMTDAQVAGTDQGDDICCKGAAKCTASSCLAMCATVSAVVAVNTKFSRPLPTKLTVKPQPLLVGASWRPEPPPPRA